MNNYLDLLPNEILDTIYKELHIINTHKLHKEFLLNTVCEHNYDTIDYYQNGFKIFNIEFGYIVFKTSFLILE